MLNAEFFREQGVPPTLAESVPPTLAEIFISLYVLCLIVRRVFLFVFVFNPSAAAAAARRGLPATEPACPLLSSARP